MFRFLYILVLVNLNLHQAFTSVFLRKVSKTIQSALPIKVYDLLVPDLNSFIVG